MKKRYQNPHVRDMRRNLWDFFLWIVGYYRESIDPKAPTHYIYPATCGPCDLSKPWALWVGHTTYLIHVQGKTLLTDPIWSRRPSPLPFFGPVRREKPGVTLDALPSVDYVLISHDHYDHLDRFSVLQLHRRFPHLTWVVPEGVALWFQKRGISQVIEMRWGEERALCPQMKVTCVPAQHFSGRWRMNSTLWCGYVVEALEAAKAFYFAGDTGYNPHDFKGIGAKWRSIDLSLIPIGSYSPRAFMSAVHIEPRQAALIHREVGSKLSLATHWKTFCLSDEPMHQPPFDLYIALRDLGIHPQSFLALEPGQRVNW
jgi:N-acyl-phosphatidylethanolamine-hydrolysing phospholipase D